MCSCSVPLTPVQGHCIYNNSRVYSYIDAFFAPADSIVSHINSPGIPFTVAAPGATASLQNFEFNTVLIDPLYSVLVLGANVPEAWDATGPDAGIQLRNTTYPSSHYGVEVSLWNDTEVYSDGSDRVWRHSNNNTEGDDASGSYELAAPISEASNSTLQFLSAADGQELMMVRFAYSPPELQLTILSLWIGQLSCSCASLPQWSAGASATMGITRSH